MSSYWKIPCCLEHYNLFFILLQCPIPKVMKIGNIVKISANLFGKWQLFEAWSTIQWFVKSCCSFRIIVGFSSICQMPICKWLFKGNTVFSSFSPKFSATHIGWFFKVSNPKYMKITSQKMKKSLFKLAQHFFSFCLISWFFCLLFFHF